MNNMKKTIMKISGNNKIFRSFLILSIFILISISFTNALSPSGATNITSFTNETAPANAPQVISAVAGNVTEINVFGYSTTQSWQGYYGNVTGTIQLADASDKVMFNWSDANPRGEIYATTNNSVVWTNIQCFNYSATGTYADDSLNRGSTSKFGMNLTQLESSYNISFEDSDSVNATFNLQDHAAFYSNNQEFSSGQCQNTKIYNSTGQGMFDEVLLYSPESQSVIFTSILLNNANGFDGRTHDFEMLVLSDGHNGNQAVSTYYFYVELQ